MGEIAKRWTGKVCNIFEGIKESSSLIGLFPDLIPCLHPGWITTMAGGYSRIDRTAFNVCTKILQKNCSFANVLNRMCLKFVDDACCCAAGAGNPRINRGSPPYSPSSIIVHFLIPVLHSTSIYNRCRIYSHKLYHFFYASNPLRTKYRS